MRISMTMAAFALGFSVPLFCARALCAAEAKPVVVFASERIAGQWVKSYFSSIPSDQFKFNECEDVIGRSLTNAGFNVSQTPLDAGQVNNVRELHTVFDRYGDLSGMPNDLAVKAAAAVDSNSRAVVVCGVKTTFRKGKRGQPAAICASAGCEAIDTLTKLRRATAADEKCLAGATGPAGSVAVIRDVCGEMGQELAVKLKGMK